MRPWTAAALALLLVWQASAVPAPVGTDLDQADGSMTWIWSDPHADGSLKDVTTALQDAGVPLHLYPRLGMAAFVASADVAYALQARFGGRVDPNEAMQLHLDGSVRYVGADVVRDAVGPVHDGPSVLVVDTGVDTTHPDFQSDVNLATNVQAVRAGGLVVGTLQDAPVVDGSGHGTHVAGIVAGLAEGLGQNDPNHGLYEGLYSNGRIIGFQASVTATGDGEAMVDTIAALEAFDWALQNRDAYDIRVVTNSWGAGGDLDPDHPIEQATLRLYLDGMTVVFSAGNDGEDGDRFTSSLNQHCTPPWVLCVGAGDLDGKRVSFSSHGADLVGAPPYDHVDIVAPGIFIKAPQPVVSNGVGSILGDLLGGRSSDALYVDRSGTSMAAPHVAGAAALLLAAYPDLSPDQVMDILTASAQPMRDPEAYVGAGYLDVLEAYNVAGQVTGNRDRFLDGVGVKYAGKASGDPDMAYDAVTLGLDSPVDAFPSILHRDSAPSAWTTWWIYAFLGGALVVALLGTRFRG